MATITATDTGGTGAVVITSTTLGASDTFTYKTGSKQYLILRNASGGALTPKLDGADGTTVPVAGIGSVSVADGLTLASLADGATVVIRTSTIEKYLQGLVTVTGGDGIVAQILEY